MAAGTFSAQVEAWVKKSHGRLLAVRNEAAQDVVEIMQTPVGAGGRMRVDTGFLRASLVAVKGEGLPLKTSNPGGINYTYDAGQVALVIAGADLKDALTFAYTANYARPREYGARGQPGDRFVALAAQQWQRVVDEAVARVKARTGG